MSDLPKWLLENYHRGQIVVIAPSLGQAIRFADKHYFGPDGATLRGEPYYGKEPAINGEWHDRDNE